MKLKSTAVFLLLLFIFLTAAISCDGSGEKKDANNTTFDTPPENETEDNGYTDDLPETDLGGYEFKILTGIHGTYLVSTFGAESESGDTLDDVLFKRNLTVSERFNVNFNETVMPDIFNVNGEIKKITQAGDDAYDIAMMIDRYALYAGMDGQLYSYNDLPYINLEKKYWDQNMSRDFSISNKLFFTAGADNLVFFSSVTHLVFNKVMSENYNLDNPYELVRAGKWTFDVFFKMMGDVTDDINGDGKYTDTDQYGLIGTNNMFWPNLWINSGYKLIEKDVDDIPYFNVPGNEDFFSILQTIHDYGYGGNADSVFIIGIKQVTNYTTKGSAYNLAMAMFTGGRSLFCAASLVTILDTRGMDDDFGIIPYPSYKEAEAGTPYGCRTFGGFPYVVPVTNGDLETTGLLMEALACESYRTVRPALYDILLKTKVSRDTDSEEMLDMMLQNRITDLGESYWFDAVEFKFEQLYLNKSLKLASFVDSIKDNVKIELDKSIEFFNKLD